MGCWVTTGTPEWLTVDAWSIKGGSGWFSGWYHKFNILLVTKEIQKIRCIQTEMYSKGRTGLFKFDSIPCFLRIMINVFCPLIRILILYFIKTKSFKKHFYGIFLSCQEHKM